MSHRVSAKTATGPDRRHSCRVRGKAADRMEGRAVVEGVETVIDRHVMVEGEGVGLAEWPLLDAHCGERGSCLPLEIIFWQS